MLAALQFPLDEGVAVEPVGGVEGKEVACRGAKRCGGIFAVNRKRRHNLSPCRHALRGHDMNRSDLLEIQGPYSTNRQWRRTGDAAQQIASVWVSKFGRKKEEAVAALLTQRNIEEAARAINISRNTLLNWMKLPEFRVAYREARRTAFRQSIARLQQRTAAAATTLLKTMIDPNTPPSVKVRAAEAIFNHAAKAIEIEDIEARVSELERATATDSRR